MSADVRRQRSHAVRCVHECPLEDRFERGLVEGARRSVCKRAVCSGVTQGILRLTSGWWLVARVSRVLVLVVVWRHLTRARRWGWRWSGHSSVRTSCWRWRCARRGTLTILTGVHHHRARARRNRAFELAIRDATLVVGWRMSTIVIKISKQIHHAGESPRKERCRWRSG
jgi:hypothetical protein